MRSAVRESRSFSVDPEVLDQIERTKGQASASERVNQLLKYALKMERKASLSQEAAHFRKLILAPGLKNDRTANGRVEIQHQVSRVASATE